MASFYRNEWPLLVICPSSLRVTWAEAFERWVPALPQTSIGVVLNGQSSLSRQVTIISYDLVSRQLKKLKERNFKVVIADEVRR